MRPILVLSACVVLATLSLLAPWALAFDPYAWLIWGRELAHGTLDTSAGPSFKPGAVALTLPISLAGEVAPELWLMTARLGALLALVGAAVVAGRLGGRTAAVCAAGLLAVSPWWLFNAALGNSEGWLAASVLWAAAAQLAGRPRLAFAALLGGSLLRPEIWPFLALSGLWLLRERRAAWWAIGGPGALVLAAWIVPGVLGGGGASSAARGTPSAGSAALADVPFLAVLGDGATLLTLPAAVALLGLAWRRDRRALALLGGGVAYVLLVAAMTQLGYSGNPRYLVPAVAVLIPLAVAGLPRLAPIVLIAAAAWTAGDLVDQVRQVGQRAQSRKELATLVATRTPRCLAVYTSVAQRSHVAWTLDRPLSGGLDARPQAPAAVLQARPYAGGPSEPPTRPPFSPVIRSGAWTLQEAGCEQEELASAQLP